MSEPRNNKRPRRDEKPGKSVENLAVKDAELLASNNPYMPMFLNFRAELDEHHDRRERVIKVSRDVTATSKKMIFSLQRSRQIPAPLPLEILSEVTNLQITIQVLLESIVPDLRNGNTFRYRQITGGLQELIEAFCFRHYLETGSLLSFPAAQKLLPAGIELTIADYIPGVFDFIGEVMRFAITMVALGGGKEVEKVLMDLRGIRQGLEQFDEAGYKWYVGARDADKKLAVMRECVEKVEKAVAGKIIRGAEMPEGWVPDLIERGRAGIEGCGKDIIRLRITYNPG
ncbi:Translin [Pyronema omphalodes]|nr:Translin [Pyronema omphalodes]